MNTAAATSRKPLKLKKEAPSTVPSTVPSTEPSTETKAKSKPISSTQRMDNVLDVLLKALAGQILTEDSMKAALKDTLSHTSKYGKAKKERPEGLPKRSLSSYVFFTQEHRSAVRDEEVNGKKRVFKDITQELGARWGALDEAGRKKYKDLAAAAKVKYDAEMVLYNQTHNITVPVAKAPRASRSAKAAKGAAIDVVVASLSASDAPAIPTKPAAAAPKKRAPKKEAVVAATA